MRRWLFGIAGLVVIALGLFQFRNGILEMFPGFGADSELKSAAEKAAKAANDFAALAKDAHQTGSVPRQTDPAAGKLIDAVFNVDALRNKTALTRADLGSLADWGSAGTKVGSIFLLSGTGVADVANVTDTTALREKADRNTVDYAPELGRYMDAELILQAAMLDVIASTNAAGDSGSASVKAGLDQVRAGVAMTITSVMSTFTINGIGDDWRRERLVALTTIAPKAAKVLSTEQCKSIAEAAQTTIAAIADASAQAGLRSVADAAKC